MNMKIQKTLGAGVMSVGLVVGLAGFAGATSGTVRGTGPHSTNVVRNHTKNRVDVDNDNDLSVRNVSHQDSFSGNAVVRGNTRGGNAKTGNASVANTFNANATIDNSASTAAAMKPLTSSSSSNNSGSIRNTGPHSTNRVVNTTNNNVDIDNDNDLHVDNYSSSTASSGNAVVRGNTRGGDATTGNASTTSSTSVTFRVTN